MRDLPGDVAAANWSYDDVARSAMFPVDDFDGDGVPAMACRMTKTAAGRRI